MELLDVSFSPFLFVFVGAVCKECAEYQQVGNNGGQFVDADQK
jgi:hypothetical protein